MSSLRNVKYEYAIFGKHIDTDFFMISNKWYISPKKAISAHKSSATSQPLENFNEVKIVEREMIITERDLEFSLK